MTQNYSVTYERVNRLIIGALVFLATFSWIDLIQTAIQILIVKNPSNALDSGSENEEEEEEREFLLGGWNQPNTTRSSSNALRQTEPGENRPGRFTTSSFTTAQSIAEANRLTLTYKAIAAFTITFITIIGVITLSSHDRTVYGRLRSGKQDGAPFNELEQERETGAPVFE